MNVYVHIYVNVYVHVSKIQLKDAVLALNHISVLREIFSVN